jgi:hypothetical protein
MMNHPFNPYGMGMNPFIGSNPGNMYNPYFNPYWNMQHPPPPAHFKRKKSKKFNTSNKTINHIN